MFSAYILSPYNHLLEVLKIFTVSNSIFFLNNVNSAEITKHDYVRKRMGFFVRTTEQTIVGSLKIIVDDFTVINELLNPKYSTYRPHNLVSKRPFEMTKLNQ